MNNLNPTGTSNDNLRIEALSAAIRSMAGPEHHDTTVHRAEAFYTFLKGQNA